MDIKQITMKYKYKSQSTLWIKLHAVTCKSPPSMCAHLHVHTSHFQHCHHVSLEQVKNIPCMNSVSTVRLLIEESVGTSLAQLLLSGICLDWQSDYQRPWLTFTLDKFHQTGKLILSWQSLTREKSWVHFNCEYISKMSVVRLFLLWI